MDIFCPLPPNTSMAKIGDTLPFKIAERMVPFEVRRIIGNILYLRSLDLKLESRCRIDFWLKQKALMDHIEVNLEQEVEND